MPDVATLNVEAVETIAAGLGIDSIAELARRSKMDRTYLSKVMAGKRPAKPSHVIAIAHALHCRPIAILGPADPAAAVEALGGEAA